MVVKSWIQILPVKHDFDYLVGRNDVVFLSTGIGIVRMIGPGILFGLRGRDISE